MNYTIELSDGNKIPVCFGTWSLARFCELNGNLSFTAMQDLFSNEISYKHIISLLLCGAEHHCKKHNLPFNYNDVEAADWIDDMGGMLSDKFQHVMTLIGNAINPKYQGVEVSKKKGEPKKKSQSHGLTSVLTVSEAV